MLRKLTLSHHFGGCFIFKSFLFHFYIFLFVVYFIFISFFVFSCAAENISDPVMLEEYVAIADYKKKDRTEVSMVAGDVVEIIDKNENGEQSRRAVHVIKLLLYIY